MACGSKSWSTSKVGAEVSARREGPDECLEPPVGDARKRPPEGRGAPLPDRQPAPSSGIPLAEGAPADRLATVSRISGDRQQSSRVGLLLRWVERLASRPLGALVLFLVALVGYVVQAVAWPLTAGRDLDEYLLAYTQMFDHDVLLPWSMLFRTPIAPLVAGGLLDPLGGVLAEPAMAILYAGSIVCWAVAARRTGHGLR